MLELVIEIRVVTKPELYSASLLELNNDSIESEDGTCQLLTRECSEVISQLLTFRKCFEQVRQRLARGMCKRGKSVS